MKKAFTLGALTVALVLPGSADAARFAGVIVAKDAKRKAVVVASRPSVRTVRAGSAYSRLRLGQRVSVSATRRRDGTYDASALRRAGKAGSVRFAAVVVQQQRALRRLIVSAGGSVFAVRTGHATRRGSAAGGGLSAGARVHVRASVSRSGLRASQVKETGRARLVELEGIFLESTETGFDLAVVERGLVHVDVPEGAVLPDFEPGDQVSMVVLIGKDGSFTFIRGLDEGEPVKERGKKPREGELEAEGILAVKAPFAVTVRRGDGTKVECAVPAGLDLGIFRVGEHVKLHCVTREDRLVLVKIRSEYGWVMANGTGDLYAHGLLVKAEGSVSVRRSDGMDLRCAVPGHLNLAPFRSGEAVKLHCTLGVDGWVLAGIRSESAELDERGVLHTFGSGLLQPRADGGPVGVRRPDGTLFSCSAPEDFALSYFAAGERVTLRCRVDGGTSVLLVAESERYRVGSDGSVEFTVHGTLTARADSSLTVRAQDGADFTCSLPPGLDLSAFPVGTQVKLHCHRLDGVFRLGFLKSEHAVAEVPH
jgi:hypothetical protein